MKYTVIRQKPLETKKPTKDVKESNEKSTKETREREKIIPEETVTEKAKSMLSDMREAVIDSKRDKSKKKIPPRMKHIENKSSEESGAPKGVKRKGQTARKRSSSSEEPNSKLDSREKERSEISKQGGKKSRTPLGKHNIFKENLKVSKKKRFDSSLSDTEAETEETSTNDLYRIVEGKIDSINQLFGIDKRVIVKRWLDLGDIEDFIAEIQKEKAETSKIVKEI